MKKWTSISLATITGVALLASAACASPSQPLSSNPNLMAKPANAVLKSSATPVKEKTLSAKQVAGFTEDVIGSLSDSKLLFIKENPNVAAIDPQTKAKTKYHPLNYYVRDLNTKKDTLLFANSSHVSVPILSPDEKYMFFTDADGYEILNLKTLKKVNVAKVTFKTASYGLNWADNTHFVYWTATGNIISVDVNGKSQTLLKTGNNKLSAAQVVGNTLYYSYRSPDTAIAYDMKSKKSVTVKNFPISIPSPNQTARINLSADGSLMLADFAGKEKASIYKKSAGSNVILPTWSPDGSKIAYVVADPDKQTQSGYIYDVKTGKQTTVSIDTKVSVMSVYWSPSGKKLFYRCYSTSGLSTFSASL